MPDASKPDRIVIDLREARITKGEAGRWFIAAGRGKTLVNLTTDGEWSRDAHAIYFYADTEAEARAFAERHADQPAQPFTNAPSTAEETGCMGNVVEYKPAEPAAEAGELPTFQHRVQPWMMACFGAEIASDRIERNHRFLEESLELVQANGCTRDEARQLVEYVYGRDSGEINQEAGGVMVTLAALCLASGLDMHAAGETELARIWTKVDQIRAKQAAKPRHSPLPQSKAAPADEVEQEELEDGHGQPCYYCGKPCNNVTGRCGQWAVGLCHEDDPGVLKWHHEQCVHERLAEVEGLRAELAAANERAEKAERERDAARHFWYGQRIINDLLQFCDIRCVRCGSIYRHANEAEQCDLPGQPTHEWSPYRATVAEAERDKLRGENTLLRKAVSSAAFALFGDGPHKLQAAEARFVGILKELGIDEHGESITKDEVNCE